LDFTKIIGMISLEMVGFYSDKKGAQSFPFPFMNLFFSTVPDFIAIVGNLKSRVLVKRIKNSIRMESPIAVESLSTFGFLPGINWSDHASFWKMGYPAVMITDTSFYRNPHYHGGSDTIETLDFVRQVEALVFIIEDAESDKEKNDARKKLDLLEDYFLERSGRETLARRVKMWYNKRVKEQNKDNN
jgi:hypothetical protein